MKRNNRDKMKQKMGKQKRSTEPKNRFLKSSIKSINFQPD